MRNIAAYLLLKLAGNDTPSSDDVSGLLTSSGIEVDAETLKLAMEKLEGKNIDELIESIFILVNEAKNKSIQLNVSKNSNYELKKAHEISQNLVEIPEILFNEPKKNNVLTEKITNESKIQEKSKKIVKNNDDLIHQSNAGDWSKIKFRSSPSHYYKSIQEIMK